MIKRIDRIIPLVILAITSCANLSAAESEHSSPKQLKVESKQAAEEIPYHQQLSNMATLVEMHTGLITPLARIIAEYLIPFPTLWLPVINERDDSFIMYHTRSGFTMYCFTPTEQFKAQHLLVYNASLHRRPPTEDESEAIGRQYGELIIPTLRRKIDRPISEPCPIHMIDSNVIWSLTVMLQQCSAEHIETSSVEYASAVSGSATLMAMTPQMLGRQMRLLYQALQNKATHHRMSYEDEFLAAYEKSNIPALLEQTKPAAPKQVVICRRKPAA